jgi:potassium-transporting ATPase KdpC subunit
MFRDFIKSLWLIGVSVVLVCGFYPAVLWTIAQVFFPFQANGSILAGPDGKPVGSLLVAQPFSKDEYFQPRPSAASYDGTASTSSGLAVSNYGLRDRVARTIGPIATYADGPKKGQPVAPDIEAWFQADKFGGQPHIVAQWADAHNALAQAWVTGDPTHGAYVDDWTKAHDAVVAQWVKDHPDTPKPQASDLAVVFFENFSNEHPGMFPSAVTNTGADGKTTTTIQPVNSGSDIQADFFAMWRDDHAEATLADIPGDLVTASASGLDPNITLQNAEFQLDRVAAKWAQDTHADQAQTRSQIEQILQEAAYAPGYGLFGGDKLINVLQVNLELRKRFGPPA